MYDEGVMDDRVPAPATLVDPRIERTRTHVLGHARDLLSERGAAGVTYVELAARARVTRQTLYRHWPTREELFADLALEHADRGMPEGSGSPEVIIGDFLRGMRQGMDDGANAAPLTALIAQADHDQTCRNALIGVVANRRVALNRLLEPSGVTLDPDQYARLCGPVLFQRFFAREPVTDQLIDQLVATWSDGR